MTSFLNHELQRDDQTNKDSKASTGNSDETDLQNHELMLGTRFVHPGPPEKYGRIVGFDGKYYQVYYPKSLECESLLESTMSKMTLVSHKRPRMKRKLLVGEQKRLAMAPSCELCKIPFEATTDSGKCPIQSQNCSHLLCFDCIQAMRVRETQDNPKKIRSTVDCPFCNGKRSFNAANPTICQAMCQMVTLFQSRNTKQLGNNLSASRRIECATSKRPLLVESNSKNHISCPSCKQAKPAEKFSSNQLKRNSAGKRNFLCRRCEERDAIKRKFGSYDSRCATSLIMKNGSKKSKFLSTILPVSAADGSGVIKQTELPSHLYITGYTREAYACLSNTTEEHLWEKHYFWSSNPVKMEGLLSFLQTEQKSAYGTFILEKKVDGFFIIPHDQPKDMLKGVLKCKYVLGVGFMDDLNPESNDSCEHESRILRKLLHSESKTHQSLEVVPRGSVQAAPKAMPTPAVPKVSYGSRNWDRERIIIKEGWESDDESDEALSFKK